MPSLRKNGPSSAKRKKLLPTPSSGKASRTRSSSSSAERRGPLAGQNRCAGVIACQWIANQEKKRHANATSVNLIRLTGLTEARRHTRRADTTAPRLSNTAITSRISPIRKYFSQAEVGGNESSSNSPKNTPSV